MPVPGDLGRVAVAGVYDGRAEAGDFDEKIAPGDVGPERTPKEAVVAAQPHHLGDEEPAWHGRSAIGQGKSSETKRYLECPADSFEGAIEEDGKQVWIVPFNRQIVQAGVNTRERQPAEFAGPFDRVESFDQDADAATARGHPENLLDFTGLADHRQKDLVGAASDRLGHFGSVLGPKLLMRQRTRAYVA